MSILTQALSALFEENEAAQTSLISKEDLTNKLKHSIQNVQFTKIDGSLRNMLCTLIADKLPPLKKISETDIAKKPRAENLNTIIVYDLEQEAWRSFRLNSIISYNEVAE